MRAMYWRMIPVMLFLVLSIFLWRGLSLDPHHLPSVHIGKPLPPFNVPQLLNSEAQFTPQSLAHQTVLLNVWASWCNACVEEQAFMLQLAREGVPVYGLNYKDNAQDAKVWLKQWGNPYQLIGQDLRGMVAIDLGVYGAPETFIIDKNGRIRYRHVGIINAEIWHKQIKPIMAELELKS